MAANLEAYPGECHRPDHREQDPADISAQIHQQKGRVGTRDQQIYCRMIEMTEKQFQARLAKAMVEG